MIGRRARFVSLLLPLLLAGCHEPLTQVVVVFQSDLQPPSEVDALDVAFIQGPYAPMVNPFFSGNGIPLRQFPVSVGFVSGGRTQSFSIVARLFRGTSQFATPPIVVSRTVTGIPFEDQETMMFVLPLLKACSCQGTSCPNPGVNPDCDNIDKPPVVPFDPAVAPPSSGMRGISGPTGGFDAGVINSPPTR
jgi:hypothetical protein